MDCIITAVYRVEPYKREGLENAFTRNFDAENYVTGVRSLLGLDKDVYVFCNEEPVQFKGRLVHVEDIFKETLLNKYNIDKLHFIPIKLENIFTRYNSLWQKCIDIANKNPNNLYCWNPPVCLARIDMMKYIFDNFDQYKNVCWVDAGLSNDSYIPKNRGGTMHDYELQNWNNYYPDNQSDMFNPKLGNRIFQLINDNGNFTVGQTSINQEPFNFIHEKLPDKQITRSYSNVGCVLGFSKKYLDTLLDEFNSALDLFIDEYNYAFTEIEVLSYLNYIKDFKKLLWSNCLPEEGNVISLNYALDQKIFTDI